MAIGIGYHGPRFSVPAPAEEKDGGDMVLWIVIAALVFFLWKRR